MMPMLASPGVVCALVLTLLTVCVAASAEQHPIYTGIDAEQAAEYEARVERVMAMTEEEMLGYVPEKTYFRVLDCPNCFGGSQGSGVFGWSIERPDELVCRYCGTVVRPPDDRYPEDHVLTGQNALGETIEYRYYLNQETGTRHFFSAHILMHKRNWIAGQCLALAEAWQATGKPEYARRAVLILDRFATFYPHYAAIYNRTRTRMGFCPSQEPPYPWDAGRWGDFHNEIPRPLVLAYDLLYDSDQFRRLSEERGYDVRARLENDFLRATYRAIELSPYIVGNVVGYDITSAAMLGRVLGDPAMVHRAVGWMMRNLDEGFFYDGTWHESPSYHYMTLGGLRSAFSKVRGYTDPPGYVDEADGTRFDDFDPEADLPFWSKVQDAFEPVCFPDGTSTPVHDTWAHERRAEPRERTISTILPGYGHASLGLGEGPDQIQAQLHFSGAYGHSHRDNLNLTLWAKEREMLSDIGYTWTNQRWWTISTISHNLVAVDRQEQQGRPSDGDLLWFFPAAATAPADVAISVVAADGVRSYANIDGLDMYRRMLVLIPLSGGNAYVVDIARTRGGSMHDWLLHGSADEDMTAETSLSLAPAGEEFAGAQPPDSYRIWREMRHGSSESGFSVTFRYAEEPGRGVRVHIVGNAPTKLYLGETPSIRRAGVGSRGEDRKALDFWMPQLAARRSGAAPLHSVFAAVEEPFLGGPFIDDVRALEVTPADPDCVAVQVSVGAVTDTIISTLDEEPFPTRTVGDITLRGRLGVVRRIGGEPVAMWLFEGRGLVAGGQAIEMERSAWTGTIEAAMRRADGADQDAFITDAELPLGNALRGTWMIVTHGNGCRHGYEIDRIEGKGDQTAIVLAHDHGLRIEGGTTEEVFFPQRTIEGENTFTIPLCARLTGE